MTPTCQRCSKEHFNFWTCERAREEAEREAKKWVFPVEFPGDNEAQGLVSLQSGLHTLTPLSDNTFVEKVEREDD